MGFKRHSSTNSLESAGVVSKLFEAANTFDAPYMLVRLQQGVRKRLALRAAAQDTNSVGPDVAGSRRRGEDSDDDCADLPARSPHYSQMS